MLLQPGVHLGLQLHRQGIAPAEHTVETAQVLSVQFLKMQKRLEDRRHAGDEVRLFFPEHLRVALLVEVRHQDALRAVGEDRMDIDPQAEAVEDRHAAEHGLAGAQCHADGLHRLDRQGVEVVVGQADPLGIAARPSAVEDDRAAVPIKGGLGQVGDLLTALEEIRPSDAFSFFRVFQKMPAGLRGKCEAERGIQLFLHPRHQHRHRMVRFLRGRVNGLIEEVHGQDEPALRQVQVVDDLLGRRFRVHHVGDGPDAAQRVEGVDCLRGVGQADGDCVALPDPVRVKGPRRAQDPLVKGPVARLLSVKLVGGHLRMLLRHPGDHLVHRLFRVLQMTPRYVTVFLSFHIWKSSLLINVFLPRRMRVVTIIPQGVNHIK